MRLYTVALIGLTILVLLLGTRISAARPPVDVIHTYDVGAFGIGTAEAFCDEGDEVSGGGFSVPSGTLVLMSASQQSLAGTESWFVDAEDKGRGMRVYAVCIDNEPFRK